MTSAHTQTAITTATDQIQQRSSDAPHRKSLQHQKSQHIDEATIEAQCGHENAVSRCHGISLGCR
jgi:hypothetical protein